jgi:hypothetical protein
MLAATSPVAAGLDEPVVSHLVVLGSGRTRKAPEAMSDLETINVLAELFFHYAE